MEAEKIVRELTGRIERLDHCMEADENRAVREILADRQRVLKSLLEWIIQEEGLEVAHG